MRQRSSAPGKGDGRPVVSWPDRANGAFRLPGDIDRPACRFPRRLCVRHAERSEQPSAGMLDDRAVCEQRKADIEVIEARLALRRRGEVLDRVRDHEMAAADRRFDATLQAEMLA